ncbi:hypothetical protein HPB47_001302 [Ixodes persulcatus]|uniref:Uncharacterized protein n=1 Tax=Ixodes persulcatus TaxID=34615 RepID=A0AC60PPS5_IXOPE|nr:hypothetical protein HPB47_001302 [Ixodes persulcatus]
MASDMETDAPQDSRAPSLETKKRKFQNDGEDSVSLTPESEEDNAGWTDVQRRRRLPAKRSTATAERLTKNKFLVLIRPRGQHPITEIPKSDLGRALIQLAPHPSLGKYVSTRMDARSNSITVTAYDSTHADRICQLHQIKRENSTPFEIEALHLRPRGTSRGVIRVDPVDTNESLKDNVDCKHAAVLDVKRMGRSNFAIVSFDTPRLPKMVRYFTELCSVSPYVPRTLVCFHCLKDGHLQKHCPNAAVCKTCGKQQHEGACATPAAYCTLCTAEGHLATDPKCPERERRLDENKSRTERRSRSRSRRRTANAAAAPAHVSSPMPSDLSTDFPPLSPDAPLTPVTTKGSYRSPARKAVNFATSCTSATPVAGTTYATATSGKPKRSKKASARTKQEIQELTTRICPPTIVAQAAVFVRKDIHHCQIDTTSFGTEYQEVVAVRIHLARGRALLVASAYVRPGGGRNRSDNYQWLSRLRTLYPLDEVVVGGDFNAANTSWGYKWTSPRGRRLEEEANDADLFLINDLDYPTRLGLHSGQRNTTPDLTWATRETIREWRCNGDPWSSDHFPRRKKVTYVDWEKYREFIQESEEASFHVKILQASALATCSIELDAETPAPDKHLLNLWTTREQLHDQYVQRGKTHTDLVRVRHKTAQIRRHSRHLGRQRWEEHCASFGKETGLRKLWGTYQALSDKKKTQGVVETVLLTQGMSHEEFEEEAANTFFPQPARTPPPASIYEPEPVNETNELETTFTPAELHTALEQARTEVEKLETLYRAALRVITGLPRHTRVEELYRYGRLPPLRDIIQDCREGTQDRRLFTLQGQRLLLSDDPTMAAILDEVPPHVPPWKDFPVTDGRPLSRKTNAQRYGPQRATIARTLNEPSTDPAEMRLFTGASWNPHTQIAAIVARTEDGCHRRQNYRLDETPSTTEVELRALQVGINWILTDPRIVSEQTKTITIYTDSSTAIRALLGPPRVGTTEYAIKNGCRIIKAQKDVAVKIQWVPGHSGQADNEAAHDLASEACTSRRSQGVPIYRPSLDHSPEEERRRRKQIRKSRLKDHVPPLENPLPRGLPRGAQVLVVKARTGFAITEDMMAKWRYSQLCHQEGDPPPPPVKRCSSCSADQAPTIRHLIWECDGLKDVREKHRPPGVTSYEEWVTPVQDQKTTLLALWSFACEASIVRRT